jgi:hypothetical protein
MHDCESLINSLDIEEIAYKDKIAYQLTMLGFINLTTNKKEDLRKLIITDVFPLKSKTQESPWAYRISTKSLGTGKGASLTVKEFVFKKKELNKMDIIYANRLEKDKNGYWYLWDYNFIK